MHFKSRARLLGYLLPALLVPASAQAQSAPSPSPAGLPRDVLPGREEIERGVTQGALGNLEGDALDTSAVERAPCALAAPEFSDIRFTLREVVFSGAEAFPGGIDLSSAASGMIGSELPVAAVCEIRDRAATILRRKGYLAAVQVPPQTIADGTLRLDVLAARVTRLQIKGDAGANEKLLLNYLSPLAEQPVFNSDEAERTLLLTRDIPGLDARLALRPVDGRPGELIGEVSVRRIPFTADLLTQNYGSEAVGRWSVLGRMRFAGFTGMGDATTVSAAWSGDFQEQQVFQIGHEFRVGRDGLRFAGDLTYAETEPTLAGANPFESTTFAATARADYPLIRSRAKNLFVAGGFDLIDQDVEFSGITLTEDRLRVLWARVDYAQIDAKSAMGRGGFNPIEPQLLLAGGLQVRHGIDVFGASSNCSDSFVNCAAPGKAFTSRLEGDATAFVVRGEGQVAYRPTPDWTFSLQPRFQYAADPLLSYEEFAGGNYTIGRGYDPGAVLGDSAAGFRSEIRYGSVWPEVVGGHAIQPYAFFDGVWVWNEDSSFDGLDPQKLFSAGAGFRANWMDRVRADAVVAVPLRDTLFDESAKGDVRLLLNVSVQLTQ